VDVAGPETVVQQYSDIVVLREIFEFLSSMIFFSLVPIIRKGEESLERRNKKEQKWTDQSWRGMGTKSISKRAPKIVP
jgi:hypothetical protein